MKRVGTYLRVSTDSQTAENQRQELKTVAKRRRGLDELREFHGGLQLMHDAIHKAIAADSEAMKRGEPPPCRTSDTKDWRDHAEGLEDEMARRNVAFIPVRFPDRSGR